MKKLIMLQAVEKKDISRELLDKIAELAVKLVGSFREITQDVPPNIALSVLNEATACIIKMLVSDDPEELRKAVKLVNKKLTDDMEVLIKAYEK